VFVCVCVFVCVHACVRAYACALVCVVRGRKIMDAVPTLLKMSQRVSV
jgi:hypothetical protein